MGEERGREEGSALFRHARSNNPREIRHGRLDRITRR